MEGSPIIEWYDQAFLVYVDLQDWTSVGLCSPACIHTAFEDDLAPFFDWQPFDHTGECQPGREWSSGACRTCNRKEETPYITFSTEYDYGGWDFCSAACVRRYYCERQRNEALAEQERRKFIGEEGTYEEYPFQPKTRQTYNKWRR